MQVVHRDTWAYVRSLPSWINATKNYTWRRRISVKYLWASRVRWITYHIVAHTLTLGVSFLSKASEEINLFPYAQTMGIRVGSKPIFIPENNVMLFVHASKAKYHPRRSPCQFSYPAEQWCEFMIDFTDFPSRMKRRLTLTHLVVGQIYRPQSWGRDSLISPSHSDEHRAAVFWSKCLDIGDHSMSRWKNYCFYR